MQQSAMPAREQYILKDPVFAAHNRFTLGARCLRDDLPAINQGPLLFIVHFLRGRMHHGCSAQDTCG
jgi:hypothetical protein